MTLDKKPSNPTAFDKWLKTQEGIDILARCGDLTAIATAFRAGAYARERQTLQGHVHALNVCKKLCELTKPVGFAFNCSTAIELRIVDEALAMSRELLDNLKVERSEADFEGVTRKVLDNF